MHKTVEKSERTRKSGQHWTQDTKRKRKEIKIRNKKTYIIQKATEISNAGQHTPIVV